MLRGVEPEGSEHPLTVFRTIHGQPFGFRPN
jgi:hypothetical protein